MSAQGTLARSRLLLLTAALVSGAACGPTLVWSRPGATADDRRRDEAECAARADQERWVPVIVQRRTAAGGTVSEGIELQSERRFDFDAYHACMEGRGYRRVREGS